MESPEYSIASSSQSSVVPLEKPLRPEHHGRKLTVGVPRELINEERRVALSPSGVCSLWTYPVWTNDILSTKISMKLRRMLLLLSMPSQPDSIVGACNGLRRVIGCELPITN